MTQFEEKVDAFIPGGLHSAGLDILQVNLGLKCNQACAHCHLSASPERSEAMIWPTMQMVIDAALKARPGLIDLTGGAPELNKHFRQFIGGLRRDGHSVQVRTNLTALLLPGNEDLPEFLASHKIRLAASMPCYLEENVRAQRGPGVFEKSIAAMKKLNALGYGHSPELKLDLLYNPGGSFLPPRQDALEADYKRELYSRFRVVFSNLLTIANMPVGRFRSLLTTVNKENDYLGLLENSFNPNTLEGLMCRRQLSVGWDGGLYDCDFNIALGLPVDDGAPQRIEDFNNEKLSGRRIVTGPHCYGCTAGCGSSCRGALSL